MQSHIFHFPPDRLPPPHPDLVSTFHPNLDWSHDYELFPVGVQCRYWTEDEPRIEATTHSPWTYTLFFYGLGGVALLQVVRIVRDTARKRD